MKKKLHEKNDNIKNEAIQGHKPVLSYLDAKIVEELLNDAFISSTDITKKHKVPLSTVQRRRRILENTILIRRYEIDVRKQGFRVCEMTVIPQNGSDRAIINRIFSKYSRNVLSITAKIDSAVILTALAYFRTTTEIHDMMVGIQSLPGVQQVKFAETIEIIRNKRNEVRGTVVHSIFR